ncbi:ATP-binding protein [Tabrizicola soli]|uniref:histidine kinase n=1 Tax=Tabrizicola soli TaxID=2185115 RepID=A0ABV7DYQ2_9RHOB
MAVAGFSAPGDSAGLALIGLTLTLASLVVGAVIWQRTADSRAERVRAFSLVADDAAPCFMTDAEGVLLFRNQVAEAAYGPDAHSLLAVLGNRVVDPAALLYRLQKRAGAEGAARQDIAARDGALRVSVHLSGADHLFWRIDHFGEAPTILNLTEPVERPKGGGTDLEDVPVALMVFGPDGVLRVANRAARDLMWQGELRAAMFHDIFEGLGRPVSDWLADVVAGRHPGGAEVLRARRASEESYLEVTLRRYVDGGRVGALAVLNDATRLKTLEAQFNQSQKMQAIGQLAGGIAHDFNNLLTAISGHCDLLLLRHGQEDPDYADLEQIRQNANRAAALVGQLLAFSRKQTLKPERLDLQDVLADLTHLLNRLVVERVGLTLAHRGQELGKVLGEIRADKRQLEQVLINLVVNARDAMPNGGSIRIETEPVTLAEPLKRDRASVPAGDYSVIRVIDTGIGIAPEQIQHIFEPFYTTKRVGEGTGLGLSTAYGIVKQSGGYIFVDSVLGVGTTFTLYFPVSDGGEHELAPEAQVRRLPSRQGEGVVLLVEDEAPVRAFASRALRLRGYTVLEAANAEEALKTLEDPRLEVDVFVTDVVMPGLDGPSWVKQAIERRPNVRVVFVSGYAEDALSEDQSRIPNSVFLPKPFSLNELTRTVQGQFH